METKYLRKIILEEIKKVLNEAVPATSVAPKQTRAVPSLENTEFSSALEKPDTRFYPQLKGPPEQVKKVTSALRKKSIIPGYRLCGDSPGEVTKGCFGIGVLMLQSILRTYVNAGMKMGVNIDQPEIDGYFGPNTEFSVGKVMRMLNMKQSANMSDNINKLVNGVGRQYYRTLDRHIDNLMDPRSTEPASASAMKPGQDYQSVMNKLLKLNSVIMSNKYNDEQLKQYQDLLRDASTVFGQDKVAQAIQDANRDMNARALLKTK